MKSYQIFAIIYDMLMDNVDYPAWSDYVAELLAKQGIKDGLILELGCGTGTITELLANKGYDMIGVDNSPEMLNIATTKRDESGNDILYLLQDMREFELYGTVRGIVSICDSLNYILEENELLKVFKLVNNYLDPDGVFIFDLNTIYKYKEMMGESTFAEERDEGSFIWENFYDEEQQINEYDLTLFVPTKEGLYKKAKETHYQRGYSLSVIKELLVAAKLEFVAAYDAFTFEVPKAESERIYVVAKCKTYQS